MARQAIYLDHNASAPLLPEARAAVVAALDLVGNPSSVHAEGRALRAVIDKARAQVARLAGAERDQVVFTSTATEAITQAIVGGARAFSVDAIVVSAGEHAAVLKAAEATGLPVKKVGLDSDGYIKVEEIAAAIAAADLVGMRLLVAVHLVNNETGIVQPVDRIEVLVGPSPHYLFVDAAQAFGKFGLEFASRAPDMMAISGHKIGGPAGAAALLVKGHADQVRLIPGGGQESGRRGGTENAAAIAGFGAACEVFAERFYHANVSELVRVAEDGMRLIAPDLVVFGETGGRIGNTSNFAVPGLGNAVAMMGLDLAGIAVSSGSACSSGKVGPSHVLEAMGVPAELGECAMRVSFGWSSSIEDVEAYLKGFSEVVGRHRARHGVAA
ncbi:MAG: aminotransferase class V-fold PLP-dependent enzyme [Devosia sp.]|uniref:cysteine desulfurase family protein n=1 Tax=Devosia sp. TaxID=1871048 RepID=UPI001ACA0451|nr:aminotransferase class V-fold PLP-dependent enzyme [Devosia sp.]MBN9314372.1 aminotransferase class V-fold PLP-dependent enzyme [Devosia sp.]